MIEAAHDRPRSSGARTRAAGAGLRRYPWPGNVRELQNIVERIAVEISDMTVGRHRPIAPELFDIQFEATELCRFATLSRSVES